MTSFLALRASVCVSNSPGMLFLFSMFFIYLLLLLLFFIFGYIGCLNPCQNQLWLNGTEGNSPHPPSLWAGSSFRTAITTATCTCSCCRTRRGTRPSTRCARVWVGARWACWVGECPFEPAAWELHS